MKSMTLEQFKEYVNKHDANRIKGNGIADIFKDSKQSFAVICKKCGSMDIEILGEDGIEYGGLTGYQTGENVIKCKSCGNAVTIWK